MQKPRLKRTPVNSAAIRSIGYNARRKLLHVEFPNGSVFEYPCDAATLLRLRGAESIGKAFHALLARSAGKLIYKPQKP